MGESCELPELKPVGVNAGLFTAGAFSKLADENLGVTAGLSSTLFEAFAGGATAGVLSKLGGEHLSLTAGLTPTLFDAFGGGLTTGVTSKLADENLGVTAGLSSTLSEAFAGGVTAGVLSKLGGEHLSLTAELTPTLSEAFAGGLTTGVTSKLADENLGVTAGLSSTLSEAFAGGATAGVLSKLGGEHLSLTAELTRTLFDAFGGGVTAGRLSKIEGAHFGLTAGLATLLAEPLGWDLTAGRFHRLPEWNPGGITAALFPDLPELDSVLTESLREPVADADVAWAVKSSDDSEADPSLEYVLARVNPAFAAQLRGAMLRIDERGPDWLTQASVSLRRVLLGMLHHAAPNELVLPELTKRKMQVDQQGRPTRRAKIDWLCESISHEASREFVRAKLAAALAALDLLNKAIHSNECPELEESFSAVFASVRSAIRHIATLLERRRRST